MAKSRTGTTKVVRMSRAGATTAVPNESAKPNYADVAVRAFELYCERGRQDGGDIEDWLQAERELYATAGSES
jgi:hypothetical protein